MFKHLLKNLFVSQYTANISTGNYDIDGGQHLTGFFDDLKSKRLSRPKNTSLPINIHSIAIDPTNQGNHEANYYIIDNMLHKMSQSDSKNICHMCFDEIIGPYLNRPYTKLSSKRLSLYPAMLWPTERIYHFAQEMEIEFRCLYPHIKEQKNASKMLIEYYSKNNKFSQYEFWSDCDHSIKNEFIKRFVSFKVKTVGGLRKRSCGMNFSSRTMN